MCLTQVGTVSQHFVGWRIGPSSRFRQRDEGVPRGPGGPPHLGCCHSNYLSQAHTQLNQFHLDDALVTLKFTQQVNKIGRTVEQQLQQFHKTRTLPLFIQTLADAFSIKL